MFVSELHEVFSQYYDINILATPLALNLVTVACVLIIKYILFFLFQTCYLYTYNILKIVYFKTNNYCNKKNKKKDFLFIFTCFFLMKTSTHLQYG